MSLLGVLLIIGSALALSRGYGKYLKERLRMLGSIIDFIKYLDGRLEGYLEPLSSAADKYKGPEELSGLLSRLRKGASAKEAYREIRAEIPICQRADGVLLSLFDSLGSGKLGHELRQIRTALEELESIYGEERADTERKRKVASALILAAALGVCILII